MKAPLSWHPAGPAGPQVPPSSTPRSNAYPRGPRANQPAETLRKTSRWVEKMRDTT